MLMAHRRGRGMRLQAQAAAAAAPGSSVSRQDHGGDVTVEGRMSQCQVTQNKGK